MIEARVDLHELDRGIAGAIRLSRDLSPVFRQALRPLRDDQKEHAKAKEGPEGSWAPLADSTRARRKGRGRSRRILGRLPRAVTYRATRDRAVGFSRARWSGAHMTGAIVGHGAKLRPRPFLWASQKLADAVAVLLAKAFGSRWPR